MEKKKIKLADGSDSEITIIPEKEIKDNKKKYNSALPDYLLGPKLDIKKE